MTGLSIFRGETELLIERPGKVRAEEAKPLAARLMARTPQIGERRSNFAERRQAGLILLFDGEVGGSRLGALRG